MPIMEIEVLCDDTNAAVVRMPNRAYPGVVVQGDSLINLSYWAETAYQRALKIGDKSLTIAAGNILSKVREMMEIYQRIQSGGEE
jgi:hypothetical protein